MRRLPRLVARLLGCVALVIAGCSDGTSDGSGSSSGEAGSGGVTSSSSRGGSGGGSSGPVDPLCNETCAFSGDGVCDDGGEFVNTTAVVCARGSDCRDCGRREPRPSGASSSSSGAGGGVGLCEDTCGIAHDGLCQDGAEGSLSRDCAYGTDCSDCGPRAFRDDNACVLTPTEEPILPGESAVLCSDSCMLAHDGYCQEGLDPPDNCETGTDCADCGISIARRCANTCDTAMNGVCGERDGSCEKGTDCADCGPASYGAADLMAPPVEADVLRWNGASVFHVSASQATVSDDLTGLQWARALPPQRMTLGQAREYCDRLVLDGAGDWRLPSRTEALSLVYTDSDRDAVNEDLYAWREFPLDHYWTSSVAGGQSHALGLYVSYPSPSDASSVLAMGSAWPSLTLRVRCVRTQTARTPMMDRFLVEGDTVLDQLTGARWLRAPLLMPDADLEDARAACEAIPGETFWSLPNLFAALTLLDVTQDTPALDVTAFPMTPPGFLITGGIPIWLTSGGSTVGPAECFATGQYLVQCVEVQ